MKYTKEEIRQIRKDFKNAVKPVISATLIISIASICFMLFGLYSMIAISFKNGFAMLVVSICVNYISSNIYKGINKSIEDEISEIINN